MTSIITFWWWPEDDDKWFCSYSWKDIKLDNHTIQHIIYPLYSSHFLIWIGSKIYSRGGKLYFRSSKNHWCCEWHRVYVIWNFESNMSSDMLSRRNEGHESDMRVLIEDWIDWFIRDQLKGDVCRSVLQNLKQIYALVSRSVWMLSVFTPFWYLFDCIRVRPVGSRPR